MIFCENKMEDVVVSQHAVIPLVNFRTKLTNQTPEFENRSMSKFIYLDSDLQFSSSDNNIKTEIGSHVITMNDAM